MVIKIGSLSDIHYDINRVDKEVIKELLVDVCEANKLDYLLIAGDLSQSIYTTDDILEDVQDVVKTEVYFVAGNHERYQGCLSFEEIEGFKSDRYINNKVVEIEDSNYVILGYNGWYDYSFKEDESVSDEYIYENKSSIWNDPLDFDYNDVEANDIVIKNLENTLGSIKGKKVIVLTHFIPKKEFVMTKPGNLRWNQGNAFMGSEKFGEMFERFNEMKKSRITDVIFGHSHKDFGADNKINNIYYHCRPIGYRVSGEWETHQISDEIRYKLNIIKV